MYFWKTAAFTALLSQCAAQENSWQNEGRLLDEDLPWLAKIMVGNAHFCSGVLINPRTVLTAASCLNARVSSVEFEATGATSEIQASLIHPDFNPGTKSSNLGVLLLPSPVEGIEPIGFGMPENVDLYGMDLEGLTWTGSSIENRLTKTLQETSVQVISREECKDSISGPLESDQFCGKKRSNSRSDCLGDRGTPLLYTNPASGEKSVVGILGRAESCGRDALFGMYTWVSASDTFLNNPVCRTVQELETGSNWVSFQGSSEPLVPNYACWRLRSTLPTIRVDLQDVETGSRLNTVSLYLAEDLFTPLETISGSKKNAVFTRLDNDLLLVMDFTANNVGGSFVARFRGEGGSPSRPPVPAPTRKFDPTTSQCVNGLTEVDVSNRASTFEDGFDTYPAQASKCWILSSNSNRMIELMFTKYDFEQGYDFVKIYSLDDYDTTPETLSNDFVGSLPVLGAVTGTGTNSAKFFSEKILVILMSDRTTQKSGFEGRVRLVASQPTQNPTRAPTPQKCKSVVLPRNTPSITFDDGEEYYSEGFNECWDVRAVSGSAVGVTFTYVDVEQALDFITVEKVISEDVSEVLDELSGPYHNKGPYIGQAIRVTLRAASSVPRIGFSATVFDASDYTNSTSVACHSSEPLSSCSARSNSYGLLALPCSALDESRCTMDECATYCSNHPLCDMFEHWPSPQAASIMNTDDEGRGQCELYSTSPALSKSGNSPQCATVQPC